MNVDTAFRSIYGREPSPEETNRFNRIPPGKAILSMGF
jgi:hypothetical protein